MPDEQTTLLFHSATPKLSRQLVREFARRLEAEVTHGRHFTCLITNDAELQRLNREFCGNDYPTDVLSFPSGQTLGFLGDVAISFQHAQKQSEAYRHAVDAEIQILMLHGVLHLLGMDHEKDRGRMARTENKWRAALGLPNGLIQRVRDLSTKRPAKPTAQPRAKK